MIVCIAEKPSVARDIARILGATTSHDGYMEGNGYQVTWTYGHLCTLKEPNDYSPWWKSWSLDTLGGLPMAFRIAADEAGVDLEKCSVVTFPAQKSTWELLMERMDQSQEEEINARINAVIPFYNEMEQWSRMEPLQARLPFVIKIN